MVLEAIGSNHTLKAKKVALEFTRPFQLIAETDRVHTWSACWDDVRTWLRDTSEYFQIPDLAKDKIACISSRVRVG
jgi:hypothetical protein